MSMGSPFVSQLFARHERVTAVQIHREPGRRTVGARPGRLLTLAPYGTRTIVSSLGAPPFSPGRSTD